MRYLKRMYLFLFFLILSVMLAGCGSSKNPFDGLSRNTSFDKVKSKYHCEDDGWAEDVKFLDMNGKMYFEFDSNKNLKNAVWYADDEEKASDALEVYFKSNSKYNFEKQGSLNGQSWICWTGDNGLEISLYTSGGFVIYQY